MLNKIARNAFLLFSSQIIARLIGFFYFVFIARILGVSNFGIYVYTLSFVYNFIPLADFGLERLVLRDISRQPQEASRYFSKLLPLRLFVGVGAYISLLLLAFVLKQPLWQIGYLAIFGLSLIPFNITMFIVSFQNAREKMQYQALANTGIILLTAIGGGVFALCGFSLPYILLSYFLANLMMMLVFITKARSWNFSMKIKIDLTFIRKAVMQSWPFAVLLTLSVFYLRLSVISLGLFKSSISTGLYGSVFKFVEGAILLPQSVALALFPLSSRLFGKDKKKLSGLYLKGIVTLFIFSLPFSFVSILFPEIIINFAYGPEYLASAKAFSILGIALFLFFINALAGNIIQNSPNLKKFLPFSFLNFLISLFLCIVLIPKYNIIGAAWAVVGGEIAGLLINNFFVFKIIKGKEDA